MVLPAQHLVAHRLTVRAAAVGVGDDHGVTLPGDPPADTLALSSPARPHQQSTALAAVPTEGGRRGTPMPARLKFFYGPMDCGKSTFGSVTDRSLRWERGRAGNSGTGRAR